MNIRPPRKITEKVDRSIERFDVNMGTVVVAVAVVAIVVMTVATLRSFK